MFLARPARFVLARRLMHRSGETSIAASAASAARNHEPLIGGGELECLLAGLVVVDDRPDRNFQKYVAALASGLVGAFAVTSALGLVLGIEAEMHERVVALAGFHDDVAALAAIAAGGPAARDKLLPAECHAAVAAVAGLYLDFCFVDEHGLANCKEKPRPEGEALCDAEPRTRRRERTAR